MHLNLNLQRYTIALEYVFDSICGVFCLRSPNFKYFQMFGGTKDKGMCSNEYFNFSY